VKYNFVNVRTLNRKKNAHDSNSFIVRSLYNYLIIQPQVELPVDVSSIWHKDVPLKVVVFVWRLFQDRLPTKDNLLRRCVIHHDARMCVAGCDLVESTPHLFLHCNIFISVWHLIYRWIGVLVTNPFYVPDHLHQFVYCGGIGKKRRSILQVIWYAAGWEIWKERNNRLFKGKESPVFQVVERIKSISYMWLKVKHISLPFNLHGWWLSPFTILCIG